jgi:glycosyltransferase involved in cell wall biosynthesis
LQKKIKIVYDHQIFTHQIFGGISRCFSTLFKEFLINKQADFSLPLLISNNSYISKIKEIAPWNFLPKQNFKGKVSAINIINNLYTNYFLKNNKNFDIFHPTYHSPYFLNHLNDKPYVMTIHDMIQEEKTNEIPGAIKYTEQKKQLALKASAIIAPSNATKEKIISKYNFIDKSKIFVVHHAPPKKVKPCANKLNINSDFFLYVGHRLQYKNFNKLLSGFSQLIKKYPKIKLICAGGTSFTEDEKLIINNLNCHNNIFQMNVNDQELAWCYSNSLAYISPSLCEGFGIPILEAFMYSCPILLSAISCFHEVAEDAAIYFDPCKTDEIYNSLSKVISSKLLRNELIQKGNIRLNAFSTQKNCNEILNIYKKII